MYTVPEINEDLYQQFDANSTTMFDAICLVVKGVLVSCISRLRYSAIYCLGFSNIAQTRWKSIQANFLLIGGAELRGKYYFYKP